MAEKPDRESKTEQPTEKRVRDSADEGNVAFSREIPTSAAIIVFSAYFAYYGREFVTGQGIFLRDVVENALARPDLAPVDAIALVRALSFGIFILLAPLFGLLVVSAIAASLAQNDPRMVLKRITPQASRISLSQGWQRLFSSRAVVEFLKSLAKLGGAMLLVVALMHRALDDIVSTMFQSPEAMAMTLSGVLARLFFAVSVAAIVIAALDFAWVRYSWWRDLHMSRQEVKDEMKQSEGDPLVKARLRSLGRDRVRRRMMKAVPTATLVVANPTHIAVALRYDRERDAAPVVVAMGADLIALRIRAIAEENGVPVFERIDLARALYKSVKVDQIIPPQFYTALAELIRIIYNASGR